MKARINLWPVQPLSLDTIKVNVGHIFMQDMYTSFNIEI